MIEVQRNIVPKWSIKNFPEYVFGEDKKLYNLKRNSEVVLKLKRYTKGYYLRSCFYSLKKMKGMIESYQEVSVEQKLINYIRSKR